MTKTGTAFQETTLVTAEDAPIGVQLWPTTAPQYARNFTLLSVQVVTRKIRDTAGEWFEYPATVIWTYESGKQRRFRLGERVAVQFC